MIKLAKWQNIQAIWCLHLHLLIPPLLKLNLNQFSWFGMGWGWGTWIWVSFALNKGRTLWGDSPEFRITLRKCLTKFELSSLKRDILETTEEQIEFLVKVSLLLIEDQKGGIHRFTWSHHNTLRWLWVKVCVTHYARFVYKFMFTCYVLVDHDHIIKGYYIPYNVI